VSLLKTYDRDPNRNIPDFQLLGDNGAPLWVMPEPRLKPGDWVRDFNLDGVGMVVAVTEDQITILWSEEPKRPAGFAFPNVRRVQPGLIANQLVSVQPMTAPTGLIFYMDYVYGDSKLDKRCKEGPWLSRMFWKAYRCLQTRTRSHLSSLRYWFRSRFGKKSISAERSVFGKKLGEEMKYLATVQTLAKREKEDASKASGPRLPGR
jgi:hypothetical protein